MSGLGRRASLGLQFQAAWTATGRTKSAAAAATVEDARYRLYRLP